MFIVPKQLNLRRGEHPVHIIFIDKIYLLCSKRPDVFRQKFPNFSLIYFWQSDIFIYKEGYEDRLLVWKLKHGNRDALRLIYEKYKNDLLTLATALSNDMATAEDVVHDVFVSFAECASKLQLRTSLRSYLLTSIANRVRNLRTKRQQTTGLTELDVADPVSDTPDKIAISAEESQQIGNAMGQLPYEQREVIILHLQSGLKFKAIAESQGVSINTVQSRYRYGLHKLQTILNGEVKK